MILRRSSVGCIQQLNHKFDHGILTGDEMYMRLITNIYSDLLENPQRAGSKSFIKF